jgi:hypothetical protein
MGWVLSNHTIKQTKYYISLYICCEKNEYKVLKTEEFYVLGYKTVQSAESQPSFQRNITLSSLGMEEKAKQETSMKQVASRTAIYSSEMSVGFQRKTRRCIPEKATP